MADRSKRIMEQMANNLIINTDYQESPYYKQLPDEVKPLEDEYIALFQKQQAYEGGLSKEEMKRKDMLEEMRANQWKRIPKKTPEKTRGVFTSVIHNLGLGE